VTRLARLRRRLRTRRRLVAAAVVTALVLGFGGYVAASTVSVYRHLTAAAGLLERLQQQAVARDVTGAHATLAALQEETAAARSAGDTLGWRVGSHVPLVGTDVLAVRTVAAAVDDIARQALPGLVDAADDITGGGLLPSGGRLALDPLRAAAPALAAADEVAQRARRQLDTIRTEDLIPRVRTAVAQAADGVDRLAALTASAARAARLLPTMLGGDRPRTYLMIFQNPAEIRASGGMPGAFAVLRADHGAVSMVSQGGAAADLKAFEKPVLPVDPAMQKLYGDRLTTFPANVNLTPHFPTTATLIREMYRVRTGVTVDGVVSVDPVALSYLLGATGPLAMPDGPPLRAETVVRLLLVDAYLGVDGPDLAAVKAKDQYFATAARTVFESLTGGAGAPLAVLAALAKAAGERRILLWNADPAEQALLDGTPMQGVLPLYDGAAPTVGVFLNDGTGAKLSYYLSGGAALTTGDCLADGRRQLRLRVTLGSDAPDHGLPDYVLGLRLGGDAYTMRTQVLIFSPTGGGVDDVRLDGKPALVGAGSERRRSVAVVMVDLAPGQRRTLEATLVTGAPPRDAPAAAGAPVEPALQLTPAVTQWKISTETGKACGSGD